MARQTVEEKIKAVQLLLTSLHDYLPDPPTSTGLIARAALPGPAPGKRVPCGYCRRTGQLVYRNRSQRTCPVCEGTGWRKRKGSRNPSHPAYEQPWDEYTCQPVQAEETQHPHAMSERELAVSLERLDFERAVRDGDVQGERYGWERERSSHERQGSYKELRRAMVSLHVQWPVGHAQIQRVHIRGLAVAWSGDDLLVLAAAEEWLAREMRGAVRVPPWLIEREADKKQKNVADLAREGYSPGQIGRLLRLPKAKVKRILATLELPGYSPGEHLSLLPGESERVRT